MESNGRENEGGNSVIFSLYCCDASPCGCILKALDTWEIRREKEIRHFKAEAAFRVTAFNSLKFIDEKHKRPKKEESLA